MKSSMLTLDVGCGFRPKGDVNLDLGPVQQRASNDPRATKANVYGDGQHLPFRDGVFESVYCAHVIEHVVNPNLLRRELERVGRTIVIVTPHWLSTNAHAPMHRWAFNVSWFTRHGYICRCRRILRSIPVVPIPLYWPDEIVAVKCARREDVPLIMEKYGLASNLH
jgi:hypothetical protein